jgi:tripartite-type tricarboxylate transporter receptor subunit TctC
MNMNACMNACMNAYMSTKLHNRLHTPAAMNPPATRGLAFKTESRSTPWVLKCMGLMASVALVGGQLSMASAQTSGDFPAKPIKLVVGYSAGGPTDVIARIVAIDLANSLGQAVLIDNKLGANGNIATESVAAAPADGYTLLVNTLSLNVNAIVGQGRVKYDPVRDFAPITLAVALPQYLIVGYNSPYKTVTDLVAKAKTKTEAVSFGSAGNGGSAHLSAALLETMTQSKMLHVPFKGNAPAMTEVMSGRVDFMFYPMIGVIEHETQKQIRILAVTTPKRYPDVPNVPTMTESGFPGFDEYVGPVGFVAPNGTPTAVLDKLSTAIRATLLKPAIEQKLKGLGGVVVASSPTEYKLWLKEDHARWSQLIKTASIKDE